MIEESLPTLAPTPRRAGSKERMCIVPQCSQQLATPYAKKCRTCSYHMKSLEVDFGDAGDFEIKRFCQKCSRFHPVEEFDGGRRSCRRALTGHNFRQRTIRRQNKIDTKPANYRLRSSELSVKAPRVKKSSPARPETPSTSQQLPKIRLSLRIKEQQQEESMGVEDQFDVAAPSAGTSFAAQSSLMHSSDSVTKEGSAGSICMVNLPLPAPEDLQLCDRDQDSEFLPYLEMLAGYKYSGSEELPPVLELPDDF